MDDKIPLKKISRRGGVVLMSTPLHRTTVIESQYNDMRTLLDGFLENVWGQRKEYMRNNPGWKGEGIVFVELEYYKDLISITQSSGSAVEMDFLRCSKAFGMQVFPVTNSLCSTQEKPPNVTISFSDNGL